MSSNKDTIIKFTMSHKDATTFRRIVLCGVIVGVFCGVMAAITATAKPQMAEVSFSFDSKEDYISINLDAEKGDNIYYTIKSDTQIDVRIMTDFEGNSYTQKDYHYTKDDEYVYKTKTDDTFTIHVEYGDDPATGTLYYAKSGDNGDTVTVWAVGVFVSLFGGMIVALIFGGIADAKYRKQEH